jgi:hypothetical protein
MANIRLRLRLTVAAALGCMGMALTIWMAYFLCQAWRLG